MCVCVYIYVHIYTCKYVYCNRIAVHPGPGGNPGVNVKTISHECYLEGVAFVYELTKETIDLPLGWFDHRLCATTDHDGSLGNHDGSLGDFFN